jgi:hypothetical protein
MASRLRIQYASDLHLEFFQKIAFDMILKPVAPLLALAGDVGRPADPLYRDFLAYCSQNWEDVFIVAGNHEFYNKKTKEQWRFNPLAVESVGKRYQQCISAASEFPNVHFLQRDRIVRRGVTFLGATLWTDLTGYEKRAQEFMNDYNYTATREGDVIRPVTPVDTTKWHLDDRTWLNQEIERAEEAGLPVVVITHHLPSYDLISPRYAGSPMNCCFASHADELIRPPVRAWIAGHTHTAIHMNRANGVQVGVNPMGYPRELGTGYCGEIFVDISTEPGVVVDGDPLLRAAAHMR